MTRTQIQLPDTLYRRAKAFSEAREISLAEMTRRGLEMFLARFPDPVANSGAGTNIGATDWQLPKMNSGGVKVALDQLHDLAADEEAQRNLF